MESPNKSFPPRQTSNNLHASESVLSNPSSRMHLRIQYPVPDTYPVETLVPITSIGQVEDRFEDDPRNRQ
ncbi:hypothetical protein N7475_001896 [Penicillium sp. IBT 31633x]|nr:hypothetical protein N7475_001896 [Penicillium sp. IBT 31633x]